MRIVFFGTPELAIPSLAAIAQEHEVAAVVCQPDRPSGRGRALLPPPTKVWADAHGISVVQPVRLNDGEFASWLGDQRPDICALTAYGRILKQPILEAAPHGILNMHPSMLPRYRGPSPIQSALIRGETETGVTIMRLSVEMDAGDIVLQERVPILPEDDGITLTSRLAELGGRKLCDAIDQIALSSAVFSPQNHANASYCGLIKKRDGQIDWSKASLDIHNLVRGAQPWPAAHCLFSGDVVKVLKTELLPHSSTVHLSPGEVLEVEADRVVVATGEGTIGVLKIQAPGKRAMATADYLRGHAILPGQRFENLP
ncbi:MAG: methionyl-tRNA formyltransferase [Candidatus Hydrogenedentes bacterium]|nr:methionyl-tRNA formyltransferase [Candidatus Hydrogenedentota bacterium]